MELVSETENCSAKLARDKNATEEQKKEDRKRRKIGIGETVTVTLNCKKPFLLEPKDQIQWKVIEGKELLEDGLKTEETTEKAKFRINPCASKEQIQQSGGKVAIEVETELGTALPRPIEFDVVFPEHLTAEHETLWEEWLKAFLRQIWDSPGMEILHMEFPHSFSFPSILWMSVLKEFVSLKKTRGMLELPEVWRSPMQRTAFGA